MATRVKLNTSSGDAEGEVVEPKGTGKAPGLVVIQEYWGVNDHIRSMLARFAAEGFVAIAPDLFHGKTTKNAEEAGKMLQALDWPKAIGEVGASAKWLREQPRSNGKVGIIGFCMGGAVSLMSAATLGDFAAVVPFYGLPPLDKVDFGKIRAPVQGHYAANDQWAKADLARTVQSRVQAAGGTMELHVYEAGHAFMNDTRPEAHDPASAKQAWARAIAFLHAHLG